MTLSECCIYMPQGGECRQQELVLVLSSVVLETQYNGQMGPLRQIYEFFRDRVWIEMDDRDTGSNCQKNDKILVKSMRQNAQNSILVHFVWKKLGRIYEKIVANRQKYVTIIVCAFAGKVHTQGSFVKIRS